MGVPTALTRELTRFVEVKPAQGTRKKALHALIVGAVTISVLSLIFGVALGLTGITGIFLGISAFDRSLRSRVRVLSRLGTAYLLLVALGAWSSMLPSWLGVVVLAVLGTIVAFGYHALLSDPPGPMLLIMGAAVASYLPTLGVPIPLLIAITAISIVLACGTSLLVQVPTRRAAVVRQLKTLRAAVSALEDAPADLPDTERAQLRDNAFSALFAAQAALVSSAPRKGTVSATHLAMEEEIHLLHRRLLQRVVTFDLPWARIDDEAFTDHYLGAPREGYLLKWALSSASPAWLAARRTGAAILLAGEFATLLGLTHPYWAIMTSALVLSNMSDRISTTHRAAQRVVGTAAGVGLFLGLHLLNPAPVLVAVIVVCCIALTQMLAPRQYALSAMVITPMPLLTASMHGAAVAIAPLVQARVLETVVGAVAALLVLWLPGRSTAIVLVRRQFRRALNAADEVLRQMSRGLPPDVTIVGRRNLHFEQLAAARALSMVIPDQPEALAQWPELEAQLGELTYTILTAVRTTEPETVLRWHPMADTLESYIAGLPPVSAEPIDASATAAALKRVRLTGRPQPPHEPAKPPVDQL